MKTFASILKCLYDEVPDRVTVVLMQSRREDVPITYRTLMQGAAGYALALNHAGVHPGEVVVLILQHGEALLYAYFGAVLHGAIPSIMPFLTEKLAPERYRQELASLIQVTRPAAIVTYPEFAPEVEAAVKAAEAAALAGSADAQANGVSPVGTHPSPIPAVLLSTSITPANLSFESWHGLNRSPDDIALLQHSSGSTGLQKGVALSHRSVFNQLERYTQAIHLTPEDRIVSWLPLYHDMGLIASFLMPIMNRVPLVLMSPFDWVRAPYKLLQAITRYRGTLTWLPNFAYNFCAQKIRERDLAGVDLSTWRAAINCSEPTYWSSHQAFIQRFQKYGLRPEALTTCYAMAENVFAVTQSGIDAPVTVDEVDQRALLTQRIATSVAIPPDHDTARPEGAGIKMLSAGRLLPNVRVRVLDDARAELPDRHIGEIALRSDCMLSGYYNRPDLTAKAFHDSWFLTGDLGYLAGGELFVTGRKKDLIIVGGKNVYPQDLERLASEVPGVHPGRVVAFGVLNEAAGTEDVVIVAEADTDELNERTRIAEGVRLGIAHGSDVAVQHVHVVDSRWLLKTSSGKIARSANRDKYLAEILVDTARQSASSAN